ncbi:HAD family phosphatase [Acetobacter sacchari]|uniref:HAD family phosphatase n=1 Tax=Acetobacter sacchari TaxID=2661687 RepID=A0ABS3LTJ9_9PROT|nr:Cof-type HAD-IIB family hydrolase [Acetobacter sacchari]MBO1359235.1 HAD family phosphatase [Acetobacter sacchari]
MKSDDQARREAKPAPTENVRLVVSDMDGTLLTPKKQVTPATLAAIGQLREAGVPVCLVSSRPPPGISMYFEALGLKTPYAGLNGAIVFDAEGRTVSSLALPQDALRDALDMLNVHGVDAWLFCGSDWIVGDVTGAYVQHEQAAIRVEPIVASEGFDPWVDKVGKLAGSSSDYDLLARLEGEIGALLEGRAHVARSSPYYLDITPEQATKGYALKQLAAMFGIEPHEVACLGDMRNDIAMFEVAGLSIAMGNATDEVASYAHVRTASNEDEGWARAIETYVLPRVAGAKGSSS